MAITKGIFNGIQLSTNGVNYHTFPRPSDFTVEREEVYAGEISTCTGQYYADRVGWKYADMTLTWDILETADLDALIALPASTKMSWTDADGNDVTENIRIIKRATTGTRITKRGRQYWKNVQIEVGFNGVHTN